VSQNAPRHPHPALLGAAVAALAVVAAASGGYTVQSGQTKPVTLRQSGTYVGTGPAPQVILAGRGQTDVCLRPTANGITAQNVETRGGYRGWQANDKQGLTLRNCISRGAGTVGARGGNCFFTVNAHGLVMDHCQGLDSNGSHCVYLSNWANGTTENVQILGGLYTNGKPPASVLQINTEKGRATKNVKITGATFKDTNGSGCLNLLGAGTKDDPIIFNDCDIFGEVNADNWSAGRPSYIRFTNSRLTARPGKPALRVAMQSRVWLDARTVVRGAVQELSGGKVVRQ
jgi:hypothetical protein